MKPALFQASPTTRLLRQKLKTVPVGSTVSYADLGAEISETVSGVHSGLQSARNSLLRSDHMVFSAIPGEGLKRLTDSEIVAASDQDIDGIRRKARKAAIKVTSVKDFAGLPPKDQIGHTTKLSIFTAVASMASDRGLKKVEAAVGGRASELPIGDTLKAFLTTG